MTVESAWHSPQLLRELQCRGHLPLPVGTRLPMVGSGATATIRRYFPGYLPRDGPVTLSLRSPIPVGRNGLSRGGVRPATRYLEGTGEASLHVARMSLDEPLN